MKQTDIKGWFLVSCFAFIVFGGFFVHEMLNLVEKSIVALFSFPIAIFGFVGIFYWGLVLLTNRIRR